VVASATLLVGAACGSSKGQARYGGTNPAAAPGSPSTTTRPIARIGTYDARAVAVAYAPSEYNTRIIRGLMAEADKAKAAGDQKRLAELKAEGEARQRRLHLQGFSGAPVDDILAQVRDALPVVARQRGVSAIIRTADYMDPAVESVDITDDLVALFHPSEKTLRTIRDVRARAPIDPLVVERMSSRD
jgi:hypothetical protein